MERIVVGVDGSDNARAALAWAVDEARSRGASLDVMLVWHLPVYGGMYGVPLPTPGPEVEESYRAQLDSIIDECDTEGMVAPIGRLLREGSAAGELLAEAQAADLLVVGSRGHGGFVGLLLGSVSHQIAAHAPCPIVIVPGSAESRSD
ncbi:MAG: universal stress protein [Acidimicrobiales bacterium]|nr:universal stress protein [Acidimicrobiales bacterium]